MGDYQLVVRLLLNKEVNTGNIDRVHVRAANVGVHGHPAAVLPILIAEDGWCGNAPMNPVAGPLKAFAPSGPKRGVEATDICHPVAVIPSQSGESNREVILTTP